MTHQRPAHPGILRTVLLIALVAALAGCAEYNSGVGGEIVDNTDEGTIREVTIPADKVTMYERGDIYSSGTTALSLGEQDGFKAAMYYRYANLTLLGDTVLSFDSAEVKLYSAGYLDAERVVNTAEWRAEVLRLDESVDPFTITSDEMLAAAMTPVDTLLLGTWTADEEAGDAEEWTIPLDSLTVDGWVRDTLSYGLYIRPFDTAGFIKRFTQRAPTDTAVVPQLRIRATYVAGNDTLENQWVEITPDVSRTFADDQDLMVPPGRLALTQAYSRQLLFQGDFSGIDPATQSINRVDLVIHADTTWDRTLNDLNAMTWYDLEDEWTANPDSVDAGTASGLFYYIPTDTNRVRFNVTPVSRRWVALPEQNFGVLIRPTILGLSPARGAFHSPESADEALRPYFHVILTEYDAP